MTRITTRIALNISVIENTEAGRVEEIHCNLKVKGRACILWFSQLSVSKPRVGDIDHKVFFIVVSSHVSSYRFAFVVFHERNAGDRQITMTRSRMFSPSRGRTSSLVLETIARVTGIAPDT